MPWAVLLSIPLVHKCLSWGVSLICKGDMYKLFGNWVKKIQQVAQVFP